MSDGGGRNGRSWACVKVEPAGSAEALGVGSEQKRGQGQSIGGGGGGAPERLKSGGRAT